MKKIIVSALCCALLLCGCSAKGRPKNMPQEAYDIAVGFTESIEKYLDGRESAKSLSDKTDTAFSEISALYDSTTDTSERLEVMKVVNDIVKVSNILTSAGTAWLTDSDPDTDSALAEALKDFKKDIGA